MSKIRKGDEVVVITGKDKGRRGKVSEVLKTGQLLVEGINVAKKHQKPNPNAGVTGGIVDQEMPIQASNVMLWNPETEKGDSGGYKTVGDKKVRFFKSNGEVLDR